MKFMVYASPTEHGWKTPSSTEYRAQIDRWSQAVTGVIKLIYHGRGRWLIIVNGASAAHIEQFFCNCPLGDRMQRDIEPLENFSCGTRDIRPPCRHRTAPGGESAALHQA